MALIPAPLVPAPEPRGLRYGLLAAANGPLNLPEPEGLGGGVRYEPVSCGSARLYPVECDDTPPVKVFDEMDPLVEADPFLVYATLQCGSVGKTPAELDTKVRRRLANGEQTAAEEQLAEILAAAAVPLTAPNDASLRSVVGELEQWLYGTGGAAYGNVGYIHASIRTAAYASTIGLLTKDGSVWRTHLGTIWSFGGGYPDDGSIYITGLTTLWRAATVTVAPIRQTFDRGANQYYAIAERQYAVAYDCVAGVATFEPEIPLS